MTYSDQINADLYYQQIDATKKAINTSEKSKKEIVNYQALVQLISQAKDADKANHLGNAPAGGLGGSYPWSSDSGHGAPCGDLPDHPSGNDVQQMTQLERWLSWFQNNPMNTNGTEKFLKFLNALSKSKSGDIQNLISQNRQLIEDTLKNALAMKYVESGGTANMTNLFNTLKGEFGNLGKYFNNAWSTNAYFDKNYKDSDGKVMEWDMFLMKAGSELACDIITNGASVIQAIYQAELKAITKMAMATKNPFVYYMLLMSIIGQKEHDKQDSVMGCGNMLKELGKGAGLSGDLTSSLAVLLKEAKSTDPKEEAKVKDFEDLIKDILKEGSGIAGAINIALDGNTVAFDKLNSIMKGKSLKDLTPSELTKVFGYVTDLFKSATGSPVQFFWAYMTHESPESTDKCIINLQQEFKSIPEITKYLTTSGPITQKEKDAAKKLAKAIIMMKAMGDFLGKDGLDSSIFPGLKELTDKIFGNTGDFFSMTGLDMKTVQKAANGDDAALIKVVKGVDTLNPPTPDTAPVTTNASSNDDSDTGGLMPINNEIAQISTFFNDQNNAQQAKAQYISSVDEKMLTFIKNMYDQPIKFIQLINQNIGKASS